VSKRHEVKSVHLTDFPLVNEKAIDKDLEERMQIAQDLSSMVLSLRKTVKIKVRQPLQKILIPVNTPAQQAQIEKIKDLILAEVNVKELEFVTDTSAMVTKRVKPDFKKLGRKLGKQMGLAKAALEGVFDKKTKTWASEGLSQSDIAQFEATGEYHLTLPDKTVVINLDEVLIVSEDIEGWQVNSMNGLTVALDTTINKQLYEEGLARELVNRLQRFRKEIDLDVTDRINVFVEENEAVVSALKNFDTYICAEVLAEKIIIKNKLDKSTTIDINDISLNIDIVKV